jgi:hypothetical protein
MYTPTGTRDNRKAEIEKTALCFCSVPKDGTIIPVFLNLGTSARQQDLKHSLLGYLKTAKAATGDKNTICLVIQTN